MTTKLALLELLVFNGYILAITEMQAIWWKHSLVEKMQHEVMAIYYIIKSSSIITQ